MSVEFVAPVKPAPTPAPVRKRVYGAAKPVSAEYLAGPGRLRLQHLMYLLNCPRSTLFKKLKAGLIPAPTGHDPRPYWSNEVIRKHLGVDGAQSIAQGVEK
jgi:hypothetical protein